MGAWCREITCPLLYICRKISRAGKSSGTIFAGAKIAPSLVGRGVLSTRSIFCRAGKDSGTIFAGAKIAPSSVGRGVLSA